MSASVEPPPLSRCPVAGVTAGLAMDHTSMAAAHVGVGVTPAGLLRAEMELRIYARRNRLLGEWAGQRMGLVPSESESYATSVVQADFEASGEEDVVRKILGDLLLAGIDADESQVRVALRQCEAEARRAMLGTA